MTRQSCYMSYDLCDLCFWGVVGLLCSFLFWFLYNIPYFRKLTTHKINMKSVASLSMLHLRIVDCPLDHGLSTWTVSDLFYDFNHKGIRYLLYFHTLTEYQYQRSSITTSDRNWNIKELVQYKLSTWIGTFAKKN